MVFCVLCCCMQLRQCVLAKCVSVENILKDTRRFMMVQTDRLESYNMGFLSPQFHFFIVLRTDTISFEIIEIHQKLKATLRYVGHSQ